MANIFGTIRLALNAIPFQVKSDFEVIDGGEVRTPIVGKDGTIHGYSVEQVAGAVEGAITVQQGLDLTALFNTTGGDVQLDFDGFPMRIIVSDATYTGPRSFNTGEGEIPIKFNGTVTVIYE